MVFLCNYVFFSNFNRQFFLLLSFLYIDKAYERSIEVLLIAHLILKRVWL